MVSLEDIKDLVMYKKPFFLPIDEKDKKKGSSIVLMTPNYKSSMIAMTAPYVINRRYFESYYFEKAITKYIKNESVYNEDELGEYLFEAKLSSYDRENLKDKDFGIPSLRKFPMPNKEHVLAAIRMFNHCEPKYDEELAKNIIKKIDYFGLGKKINVGEDNRFFKFWKNSRFYHEASVIDSSDSVDSKYINNYKVNSHTKYLDDKFAKVDKSNIVFNGYNKDIREVSRYFSKTSGVEPFERMNLEAPEKITIYCISDPTVDEEITYGSLTVFTPKAFKEKGYKFKYTDYIRFIVQLYAVYRIRPLVTSKGVMVLPQIAEPMAIFFSGIADKYIKDNDPNFKLECVVKYIVKKYGVDEMVNIARFNDINKFIKYGRECSIRLRESDDLFIDNEEIYQCLTEEGEIPIPESIKKVQNFASNLKRRIRKQSVYKLNKIARDMERGNVGKEEKGAGLSTLQQLQTGDISGVSKEESPSDVGDTGVSESVFKSWTNGDYIQENNLIYLFEDNANINYDLLLRKIMYQDRIRTDKEALQIYRNVKLSLPFIKYTYVDIARYNKKNVFIDLSRYNESFFKNIGNVSIDANGVKPNTIRSFKLYSELFARLINSSSFAGYTKRTIFIPVLDWKHNNSTRMWMFKEDINPISIIYYYMKHDQNALKKLFGNSDVVFMGAKNYFKINFSTFNFTKTSNVTKFMMLIKRIVDLGYNSPADPDPAGELEDSPKGIAMDIVDKIEKSQNVEINNVSKFSNLKKETDIFNDEEKEKKSVEVNVAPMKDAVRNNVVSTAKADGEVKSTKIKDGTDTIISSKVNVDKDKVSKATKVANDNVSVNTSTEEDKKDAIVDAIAKVANTANNTDDALSKLDDEEFKAMIAALNTDSENNIRVDKARASKITQIEDEFHQKEVAGKSVKDMLESKPAENKIPSTKLKVASINNDWDNLTFMNFDKNYDPDADMVKMLDSMQYWTYPIAVKNIDVKDNSTSEDILDLWTIECVDYKGSRFTIKVDIPRFINNTNFLKLRGNEKNILIQSVLIPIIKTGLGECQIIGTGGYNKIFVRRFGGRKGQSLPATGKLIKSLNRYMRSGKKDIEIILGDNTNVCTKYELPIDYIDIASCIDSIDSGEYKFYFNQDALRTEYQVDDTKGLPVGICRQPDKSNPKKKVEKVVYFNTDAKKTYGSIANFIGVLLSMSNEEDFGSIYYNMQVMGSKYTYSQASVLSVKIPVIIVCGYLEGLITTLQKAHIEYEFVRELDKKQRYSCDYDYIKFLDGYLVYKVNYSSSLLMNGLKESDTENYSIKDVNSRRMYFEFLDSYGGGIKADGLENSYDCMIDPITKEILEMYKLPTDYVSIMLHANNLLSDNKYTRHTDQAGRRWRRKEVIAGYFYKALTTAYEEYASSIRHNRRGSKLSMKQSAVIDLMLSKDPSTTDYSVNNVINDVECANTVTNKGLVGMNEARAYSIGTRTYDESMLNLLGMDTGFSGNVGINRQATIDANIDNARGIAKTIDGDVDKLSVAKTMTITEAMTPLGVTHDDPQRTLMTFLQTSKHMVRCQNNDPTLITNGADEALPYLASEIFSVKADQDGVVVEVVDEPYKKYMVVQFKDGTNRFIDLSTNIKHNSDGGYFVPMKLSTDLEVGKKFKAGEVIAYDKLSFSKSLGESGNLAANVGTLAKVAIINTDEGFEDAAAVSESFTKKLGTAVIMNIETVIDKGSNLFVYKTVGDKVMEGDTLFAFSSDFDDDVANTLLKNLSMNSDQLSELGRKPVKTKYTGVVQGIEIYRTVELDELSPSLREFVVKYENNIKRTAKVYDKYGLDTATLPPTKKVPNTGKAKNVDDGVKIIYYIQFIDNLKVGDKIVFYSANKGVVKYIIPEGEEPYSDYRPQEVVDAFMSLSSISGRMTLSIALAAAASKCMVELDRSIKDIAGIPYDVTKL